MLTNQTSKTPSKVTVPEKEEEQSVSADGEEVSGSDEEEMSSPESLDQKTAQLKMLKQRTMDPKKLGNHEEGELLDADQQEQLVLQTQKSCKP